MSNQGGLVKQGQIDTDSIDLSITLKELWLTPESYIMRRGSLIGAT